MSHPKPIYHPIFALLVAAFLLFLVVEVLAGTNPQILFTDNIQAVGTSIVMTPMKQVLLGKLNAATTSIDAAIYDFNRVSIRDALIAAHGRGVIVRIVTDDDAYLDPDYHPHYMALETAGISVIDDARSSIMHNKFFVVDGEVVWTGSANMSNTAFTYNHENAVVLTSTLLAEIYTLEFEEMFVDGRFGVAKTDNVTHTVDYNGIPLEIYFSPSDGAMTQVIDEVNGATESIQFGIFFFTDDTLREAILAKLQIGVTVSGIWDALGAGNPYSEDELLCGAGADIKIEDFGGKMHNKFMVIDGSGSNPVVITGSMNWSASGNEANDENTLIVHDTAVAQAYVAAFEELYNVLGPETLCEVSGDGDMFVYLPVVMKPLPPTATPTSTHTPTVPAATATATPTVTPSATPTVPPGSTGDMIITTIFYDGSGSQEPDEYVEILNDDTQSIQLNGWTLRDEGNHIFTFPSFVMQPGQVCRVYTNEIHPEWCGFGYGSGTAIWNNSGDCADLRNSGDATVDSYCYP